MAKLTSGTSTVVARETADAHELEGPMAGLLSEFDAAHRLAVRCGLSGNQAVLSACRAVARTSGLDPLQLLGVDGLRAPDVHFAPSQFGRHLGISARQVNLKLASLGLQARLDDTWVPTAKGRDHAVVLDVGKHHGDGAPVTQLRWKLSVLTLLAPDDLLACA